MAACGAYAHDMELNCPRSRSFREFLESVVDVETGQLTGYYDLCQIATLPVVSAVAGTAVMIRRSRQAESEPASLAPGYGLVSTQPYLPKDAMALALNGSTNWPDRKALTLLGQTRCDL